MEACVMMRELRRGGGVYRLQHKNFRRLRVKIFEVAVSSLSALYFGHCYKTSGYFFSSSEKNSTSLGVKPRQGGHQCAEK